MLLTRLTMCLNSGRTLPMTGLAVGLALAVGCSKNDRAGDPLGQKGLFGQQSARSSPVDSRDVPMAQMPKILPQTHYAAGRLFESQGQVGKAIEQYRRALLVNHNFPECHHRLGRMLSLAKQHDEALTNFAKAVELKPENAAYRNDLAFSLMYHERWNEAERHLRKAVELEPRFVRAHVNLGLALSRQDRFEEALDAFRTVLPEPDAQYNLGLMYRGQQRYSEAATSFRQVLTINPEFPAARVQLDQMSARIEGGASTEQFADSVPSNAGLSMPSTTGSNEKLERSAPPVAEASAVIVDIQPQVVQTATIEPTESPRDSKHETRAAKSAADDADLAFNAPPTVEPAAMHDESAAAETAPHQVEPQIAQARDTSISTTVGSPTGIDIVPTTDDGQANDDSGPADAFLGRLQQEVLQQQAGRGLYEVQSEGQPQIVEDSGAPAIMQVETTEPISVATEPIAAQGTIAAVETDPLSTGPLWLEPSQMPALDMGPPTDAASELILADFARTAIARSEAVVERNWRDRFSDLIRLADQSRNEQLCWQDLDERAKALLASGPAIPRPQATDWPVMTNELQPQPNSGPAFLGSPAAGKRD